MKIMILTVPLRDAPGSTPPYGALSVMQSLIKAGYDPELLDINVYRQPDEEVQGILLERRPDVVGISAVVSTAYSYTKKLCLFLREALPETRIVVGGNLCASAEILHRFAQVDACVLSEGERTMIYLVEYYESHARGSEDDEALQAIKGISFIDGSDRFQNTGYPDQIPPSQLAIPDFGIVEKFSDIDHYISPTISMSFSGDERFARNKEKYANEAVLYASKGCVNHCSFCHRWDKGLRMLPVDHVIETVRRLKKDYNVGFFQFADECFGTHRRKTAELVAMIKDEDILFEVGGVRVNTIDRDILASWKDAGCTAVYFGMESGSADILRQMEKNTTIEENYRAIDCLAELGIFSVMQIVIGMPSENHRTIKETGDMIEYFIKNTGIPYVSINFAQALPGTPLYEYDRLVKNLNVTMPEEEHYLELVSNKNAADPKGLVNHTGYSYITLRGWMYSLYQRVERCKCEYLSEPRLKPGAALFYVLWLHSHGSIARLAMRAIGLVAPSFVKDATAPLRESDIGRSATLYRWRTYLNFINVVRIIAREEGPGKAVRRIGEHFFLSVARLFRRNKPIEELRTVLKKCAAEPESHSETNMQPLRNGR